MVSHRNIIANTMQMGYYESVGRKQLGVTLAPLSHFHARQQEVYLQLSLGLRHDSSSVHNRSHAFNDTDTPILFPRTS